MPYVKCKVCKKEFYVKTYHYNKGWGKYCSKSCQSISQRTGKLVKCEICGKQVWKMLHELNTSISGKFFCNKSCQTKWRNSYYSGPRHAFWKTGIRAYRDILLRQKGLIKKCRLCGINDLRILAVHHVDQNRRNNDIKNLIWLCYNCHHLVHGDSEEMKKLMRLL